MQNLLQSNGMEEFIVIDIDYIMDLIDWNQSLNDQEKGIRLAKDIETINAFIQPCNKKHNKNVWENCAKILSDKTDEELSPYLVELLHWIQDLNWPGALIILDRLKIFSGKRLKRPFLDQVTYAIDLNDEEGLMWLDCLSELLDNEELKAELPKPIAEKLEKHYKNHGFWYDE